MSANSFEVEGVIQALFDTIQVSEKFQRRDFRLKIAGDEPQYDNIIKFQAIQKSCALFDNYKVGDTVKLTFSLQGKLFEKDGKENCFTNLNVYRVDRVDTEGVQPKAQPAKTSSYVMDDSEPLPF